MNHDYVMKMINFKLKLGYIKLNQIIITNFNYK